MIHFLGYLSSLIQCRLYDMAVGRSVISLDCLSFGLTSTRPSFAAVQSTSSLLLVSIHTRACTCACMHVCLSVHIVAPVCVCVCVCVYVCVYTCVRVCMHIWLLNVCMQMRVTCVPLYTHSRTRTDTHCTPLAAPLSAAAAPLNDPCHLTESECLHACRGFQSCPVSSNKKEE